MYDGGCDSSQHCKQEVYVLRIPILSKIFDEQFIEISALVLETIEGKLPFDVFIRRASNTYTKLFPRDEPIDQDRIESYRNQKHISAFYVQKGDYKQYLLYVEEIARQTFAEIPANPNDHIEGKTPPSAKKVANLVKEMISSTMFEIMINHNVDHVSVASATRTVNACIDILAKEPRTLIKIIHLMTKHPYTFRHSLSTAVFAMMLAQASEFKSDKSLRIIGLGAFLHDIGMSRLPFDPEEKKELSPEEWKDMKEHPLHGKRLIEEVKGVPSEVRAIVLQHHEQPNGNGYPSGLRGRDIYPLAKAVSIADSFAALISARPFRPKPYSPQEAISLMMEERGSFDPKLLEIFAGLFIKVKKPAKAG